MEGLALAARKDSFFEVMRGKLAVCGRHAKRYVGRFGSVKTSSLQIASVFSVK